MNTKTTSTTHSLSTQFVQILRVIVVFFMACPCEGEAFSVLSSLLWLAMAALTWFVTGAIMRMLAKHV